MRPLVPSVPSMLPLCVLLRGIKLTLPDRIYASSKQLLRLILNISLPLSQSILDPEFEFPFECRCPIIVSIVTTVKAS